MLKWQFLSTPVGLLKIIEEENKKIEKDKADELRNWMTKNNITTGINIDEDSKRYYTYNDLAAQVIGFCGSDNQGLDGVEAKYDDELKGKTTEFKEMKEYIEDVDFSIPEIIDRGRIGVKGNTLEEVYEFVKKCKIEMKYGSILKFAI